MVGIYKITNPKGKVYVGQSININRRFKSYCFFTENCKKQNKIYNSLKKYGVNAHKFEVLCLCDVSELNKKERYYQDFFDCIKEGLNCVYTKTSDKSGCLSEQTKEKIRISLSGKILTEERKANISKSKQNISEETRRKIGEKSKGRIFSVESRLKISKSKKGKKQTAEHAKKRGAAIKGRIPWNKGLKISDKYAEFKSIYLSDKNINKTHIAKKLNVSRQTIIVWCKEIEFKQNILTL